MGVQEVNMHIERDVLYSRDDDPCKSDTKLIKLSILRCLSGGSMCVLLNNSYVVYMFILFV